MIKLPIVLCDCGEKCLLHKTSEKFYGGRDFGPVWVCPKCGSMVGCHKNSSRFAPMGRPADEETRRARIQAHEAFDTLWGETLKSMPGRNGELRQYAYIWLAFELRVNPRKCHIGEFDAETCRRVVAACKLYRCRHNLFTGGANV